MISAVRCRAHKLLQRAVCSHTHVPHQTLAGSSKLLSHRAFSSSSSPAVNTGEESDFDNEFLEDVLEAIPTDWSTTGLVKKNVEWGKFDPPSKWATEAPKVDIPSKKPATHTKTTHNPRKLFQWNKYTQIVNDAHFILVLTHYMNPEAFDLWQQKVKEVAPDIVISSNFKNAMLRTMLNADPDLKGMTPLFRDKVVMITGTHRDQIIQDMHAAMKVKGELLWLGGSVQKTVLDHAKIKQLSMAGSEDAIRAQIIGILLGAPRNLVRVLKYPTDTVVKVLNFKATPEEGEGETPKEGEGEAAEAKV